MGLMNAFDSQTEDSSPVIGRNLRSRPLARKKLSEMVEEELEQMIRLQAPLPLHLPVPLSVLTAHLYMSDTGN